MPAQRCEKMTAGALAAIMDELWNGECEVGMKNKGISFRPGAAAPAIVLARLATPLGAMVAGALPQGICLLEFLNRSRMETQLKRLERVFHTPWRKGRNAHLDTLQRELDLYFMSRLREFHVPLVLAGSAFQEMAWRALQAIPFGQTRSYKQQAILIGRPKATRAVGRANAENPISIIVPCHRVIGENSQLTGYGGGLWRKRYLLELEQR